MPCWPCISTPKLPRLPGAPPWQRPPGWKTPTQIRRSGASAWRRSCWCSSGAPRSFRRAGRRPPTACLAGWPTATIRTCDRIRPSLPCPAWSGLASVCRAMPVPAVWLEPTGPPRWARPISGSALRTGSRRPTGWTHSASLRRSGACWPRPRKTTATMPTPEARPNAWSSWHAPRRLTGAAACESN